MLNMLHLSYSSEHATVGYAENFHGGFHSLTDGGHLYLVCAVCDVTI